MRYSPHYAGQILRTGGKVSGGPGEQREAGKVHAGGAALLTQLGSLCRVVVAKHVSASQQEDATYIKEAGYHGVISRRDINDS